MFLSNNSVAIDLHKARNWKLSNEANGVLIGVNKTNSSIWYTITSEYQTQQDGSILLWSYTLNKGEPYPNQFVHLDCRLNYTTVYWDKFNSTGKSNGSTIADDVRNFFCFNTDSNNNKYLAYGGILIDNDTNYKHLGWYPELTVKEGDEYILSAMQFRNTNGEFVKYSFDDKSIRLNCLNKTVKDANGISYYKDKIYSFLIDTACGVNNVLEANGLKYSFNNNPQTSSSGIDKDSIKQTCRDLGFSEGTDKYGECVLQLLEK